MERKMELPMVSIDNNVKIANSACQLKGGMEAQPDLRYIRNYKKWRPKYQNSLSLLSLIHESGSLPHEKEILLACQMTRQPLNEFL